MLFRSQDSLAAALASGMAALPSGRWLVLQLDGTERLALPEAVEVLAWPRQAKGAAEKRTRQATRERILTVVRTIVPSATKPPGRKAAEFAARTKETLAKRVGFKCSRPDCGRPTAGPHEADPGKWQCIGEAAHIEAAAIGGKRYNPSMDDDARRSAANGLWLCRSCHTLIDADDVTYTVAELRKWKRLAEEKAKNELKSIHRKPVSRSTTLSGLPPLDFLAYRKERSEGFTGRTWLFEAVQTWAMNPDSGPALLITADFGVGKTAFVSALIEGDRAGIPIIAQHFCRTGFADTLSVGRFIRSLAEQLAEALPAYRDMMTADENNEKARDRCNRLREADTEPQIAFEQAVLHPLSELPVPQEARLLVVDALEEARDASAAANRLSIVDLLKTYASQLPRWLKVLATSRNRREVVEDLQEGAFSWKTIDAERRDNQEDIYAFVEARCQADPLVAVLQRAGMTAAEMASIVQEKSCGKFLYAVTLLRGLSSGSRTIQSRADMEALPKGMDDFYKDIFNQRFPAAPTNPALQPLLGLLCVKQQPLGYHE